MGKDSIMADQINSVSINDLPVSENCELSDRIRVYTLSGKTYVPGTMKISDLSNFIFTGEEMENLKNKYESLEKTWNDFQTWLRTNFVSRKEVPGTIKMPVLSNIVSTSAYFTKVYNSVYNVDKVKDEIMNEYATPQDLENLKAAVYSYIENLALSYGGIRSSILKQMSYVSGLADAVDD